MKLVDILQTELGDMLYLHFDLELTDLLPSPEDLKGKVLLKVSIVFYPRYYLSH